MPLSRSLKTSTRPAGGALRCGQSGRVQAEQPRPVAVAAPLLRSSPRAAANGAANLASIPRQMANSASIPPLTAVCGCTRVSRGLGVSVRRSVTCATEAVWGSVIGAGQSPIIQSQAYGAVPLPGHQLLVKLSAIIMLDK